MSLFGQTLILYLVVGSGVAGAVYLTQCSGHLHAAWFLVASAILFWPLYLPVLLSSGRTQQGDPSEASAFPPDELTTAIRQVDAELAAALGSLDGWAEEVLIREKVRLRELSAAWLAQAKRIREMDRVLAQPEYAGEDLSESSVAARTSVADNRLQSCRQARRENVERLRRLRQRAHDDLLGSLAWVRELVSMIHLAKFTGAPASRAEELVAQIAAAIEGISAVTWQESSPESNGAYPKRQKSIPTRRTKENVPCDYSSASATSSPPT
jgi:hypothetical protein